MGGGAGPAGACDDLRRGIAFGAWALKPDKLDGEPGLPGTEWPSGLSNINSGRG